MKGKRIIMKGDIINNKMVLIVVYLQANAPIAYRSGDIYPDYSQKNMHDFRGRIMAEIVQGESHKDLE